MRWSLLCVRVRHFLRRTGLVCVLRVSANVAAAGVLACRGALAVRVGFEHEGLVRNR